MAAANSTKTRRPPEDRIGQKFHGKPANPRVQDLTGCIFGRLAVIAYAGTTASGQSRWLCRCHEGNESVIAGHHLKSGKISSCGCLRDELARDRQLRHGMSKTKTHRAWLRMIERCENPSNIEYPRYGGRGIRVCDRWRNSFEAFLADVGERPSPRHSLDRYPNNDGNYDPANCRWATPTEQARNRRSNRLLTCFGHTATIAEWAEISGINAQTITWRLGHEWPAETAVSTPSRIKR